MSNDEIAAAVQKIVAGIPQNNVKLPGEAEAIKAGVALLTNLLQNINTIARRAATS